MNKQAYMEKFGNINSKKINDIILAINFGLPESACSLDNKIEQELFRALNESLCLYKAEDKDFSFDTIKVQWDEFPALFHFPQENFTEFNIQKLEDAIVFAIGAHKMQLRKGTRIPYIAHPLEVLAILSTMACSTDAIIAGVLHDTIEDTDIEIEEISKRFGSRVASLVQAHSEDKSKSWQERKEAAIAKLKDADYELKCIVLADKLSNMRAIKHDYIEHGESLWHRFNASKKKQSWYYSNMIDAFFGMQSKEQHIASFYWELNALFKDVFVEYHYYDGASGILLWQWDPSYSPYVITKDCVAWRDWSGEIPSNAVPIPRGLAEYIEDAWAYAIQESAQETITDQKFTCYSEKYVYLGGSITNGILTLESTVYAADELHIGSEQYYVLQESQAKKLFSLITLQGFIRLCQTEPLSAMLNFLDENDIHYQTYTV